MNIILISSDYAFPFRLQDSRLSFNINNFDKFICAGEVPPKDVYKLLTTQMGVADNLAIAFIDHYGGHIWDIYKAIDRLATLKENFWALSSLMEVGVVNCLDWKGVDDGDMKKMQEALCQLAVTGFFPVEKIDDPICRVMSENNVGGVVSLSSVVVGLPVDVWKRTEFEHGLVPSKQSMRLTIAKVMNRRKLL